MIGRLSGILVEKTSPNFALIDVQGVGYEVELPLSSFAILPNLKESVTLHIQHILREDASLLYGFSTREEREAFRLLIKVSGIGPKSAIGILSGLSVADLFNVIQSEDIPQLVKVPGVGKKTAERLIVELRDKISILAVAILAENSGQGELPITMAKDDPSTDAVMALASLGYSTKAAEKMVKQVVKPGLTVDELVRRSLQNLMKK